MTFALDATYSLGEDLSGVGVYSREILYGVAKAHPESRFRFCYRPHRYLEARREALPANCRRALLLDRLPPRAALFHGLNQRLPARVRHPAVATFHDLFVLTGDYSTPEFRRRFAAQARDAAARADLIIAVSAFTARQVEELLGVERARLRVIHHGVRAPAPGGGAREKVVLHVGAVQRRKNVARLVEAFEALGPDWRLVLAGGAGFGAEEIFRRIEASRARGRITVTGYLPRAELDRWYKSAAIFAFPSLDEGFGMPVLEAMAAGLPVVTSSRSALPEVAGDAALLVDPLDTGALADALHRLAAEPGLRETLTTRGFARAAGFTWEKAAEATWLVYKELVERGSPAPGPV